jgi:hypothetical protein
MDHLDSTAWFKYQRKLARRRAEAKRIDLPIKQWRTPDDQVVGIRYHRTWAVWYGPAGINGDYATEIESTPGGWVVREYQCVLGYFDEYNGPPFLCTETFVSNEESDQYEIAIDIGVKRIAYYGGDESFVDSLP